MYRDVVEVLADDRLLHPALVKIPGQVVALFEEGGRRRPDPTQRPGGALLGDGDVRPDVGGRLPDKGGQLGEPALPLLLKKPPGFVVPIDGFGEIPPGLPAEPFSAAVAVADVGEPADHVDPQAVAIVVGNQLAYLLPDIVPVPGVGAALAEALPTVHRIPQTIRVSHPPLRMGVVGPAGPDVEIDHHPQPPPAAGRDGFAQDVPAVQVFVHVPRPRRKIADPETGAGV